jgi:5-methylcytosine-specific restriction protein A
MPRRREFPAKVKVAAYERSGGHCEECTAHLYPGKFHYDHVMPDAMGGEPTLENCSVLCLNCHGAKTTQQDVPRIAKTRRVRQRHINAKAKSRAVIPGSKASPLKKKLSGEVEWR